VDVVIPTAGLNLSGGIKNLLVQAAALSEAGHAVRLIVPDFASVSPYPIPAEVKVEHLATGSPSWPRTLRRLVYYARLAWSACAGADLCLVVYFPTVYCAVVSRLARRTRTTIVYSVAAYEPLTHGSIAEASAASRLLRALLARASYRLATRKIYASRWLRDQVGDPGGVVIGRGIDTRVFSAAGRAKRAPSKPIQIGAIGRSGAVKGHADFVAATSGLPGVEVRIVLVDPVALPSSVKVQTVPSQDEQGMAEFYRACDIFVFSSLSEGFPAPPLEAMASGCAVVTTDCGGVREYAQHEGNALVVPPGNAVALRAAVQRLCDDERLRERLSERGMATAQEFDRARMLQRFSAVVRQLELSR
jgi:glycosyltransferase involved in cell wall biosynthesis